MSQKIVVISPCKETCQVLCDELRALSYTATSAAILSKPSAIKPHVALFIIDQRPTRLNISDHWVEDCISTRSACLILDGPTQLHSDTRTKLDPLCDTLIFPEGQSFLAEKIHSLLAIRKLTLQLDATRHQLIHHHKELREALQSAAFIQRSLIPTQQPSFSNLHYSWQYMPCKQVGGDLFNIVQLDERTIMTYLLDVSGHGISAAMVTVSVHQSLSLHTGQLIKRPVKHPPFYEITPPGLVLQELETEYPFERFDEFFTISYMLINPHTGQLHYSNAGHPPPLLLRSDGGMERLSAGGTLIGMGKILEFVEGGARMNPGDRLFMYTDGITEHFSKAGEAYGEERLLRQLQALADKSLDEVTQETLIALREFGGNAPPIDDVTLIGIEFRRED